MDSGTGLHDSGRHLLGPHVIGQRVVVRRVVRGERGPTGGPALTDLLGVCTSWGDGVCVVQPASGAAVAIPIADIVSGKPVPPRPSVRHRVSARDAEAHVASLWPELEAVELGEWVMRSDPAPTDRLFKRANSALAIGDPGLPLADALDRVVDFYDARERLPMLQVLADEAGRFDGWEPVPGGDSMMQLGSVSRAARAVRSSYAVDFESLLGDSRPARVGVSTDGDRVAVELRVDGDLVAGGRAALSGDWLGVHDLWIDVSLRRRGLARRITAELLEWGAERGASTVWLHVETDNTAALALYESLGLRTHHELRYLTRTCG